MTLGEVGTWQSGGTPSRSNKTYYGGNIPWLKTGDLNDGLISDIPESITEEAVANSSAKINPAGSVLIAMYGATIGKLGILTFPATTNQACCACIEFNAITQLYLFYFLLSQRNGFIAKGGGGAQPNISKEIIVNTFIPLPPLSEQQRIVMEIEKWFALIDQVEQGKADLQNTIKQTKSKILDLAIHGKLVPQDPNDEPAIKLLKRINPDFTPCDNGHSRKLPQGWYSVTANDVCSIIGGVSYNKADIQDTGIRVLRGGNIQNGKVIDCFDDVFISLSYQNNDNQVQRGDIIVVASTGSQTLIGKTGFADRDIPKTQIGAFLRIVRPKQKTLSPYIRLIFQTDAYKDYIRNVAKGSNINNVKNAHLQNFQICLPPLEEQQRIVQKIEELFSSLDDILTALEV
jgi:type I restriction enzyme S subunit